MSGSSLLEVFLVVVGFQSPLAGIAILSGLKKAKKVATPTELERIVAAWMADPRPAFETVQAFEYDVQAAIVGEIMGYERPWDRADPTSVDSPFKANMIALNPDTQQMLYDQKRYKRDVERRLEAKICGGVGRSPRPETDSMMTEQ